jgi:DNA helicase-2/ATP-dependent DNA helicase PcrA
MSQHNLILKLSESIDCLVFGDPMQSIFDFDSEGFNWNIDLCNNFVRNSNISLDTPYRWINSGTPNLGIWVQGVREKLKNGKKKEINSLVKPTEIKIEKSESNISADDYERIVATEICKIINDLPPKESVLVLVNGGHSRPNLRHTIARNMFCKIQSIEKIESPVLISFLSNLDTFTNSYRRSPISLYNLIRDFAKKCMTGTSQISQSLNLKLSQYPTKSIPELRQLDNRLQAENGKLYNLILDIYEYKKREITLNLILKLVKDFTTSANNIYRKEIWRSAVEAITMALRSENKSLKECGISIRQKTSFLGRNFNRVIGTTLLTKGLEFDHVIILNLSNLDDKNLYVALSRASKSITILK